MPREAWRALGRTGERRLTVEEKPVPRRDSIVRYELTRSEELQHAVYFGAIEEFAFVEDPETPIGSSGATMALKDHWKAIDKRTAAAVESLFGAT